MLSNASTLTPFFVNGLRLEFFFDAVEDSDGDPISESPIDGGPFSEFFGQGSPSATVFCDVVQGSPKGEMIDNHIAALLRKQLFDTFNVFLSPFHERSITK